MICKKCNCEISDNSKYCPKRGEKTNTNVGKIYQIILLISAIFLLIPVKMFTIISTIIIFGVCIFDVIKKHKEIKNFIPIICGELIIVFGYILLYMI